jgi:hypothetical protein
MSSDPNRNTVGETEDAPSRPNDGASNEKPEIPPSGSGRNSPNTPMDESNQANWSNHDYWWRLQQAIWQLIEIEGLIGTAWRLAMLVLTSMSLDADADASDFTTRDLAERLGVSAATISRTNKKLRAAFGIKADSERTRYSFQWDGVVRARVLRKGVLRNVLHSKKADDQKCNTVLHTGRNSKGNPSRSRKNPSGSSFDRRARADRAGGAPAPAPSAPPLAPEQAAPTETPEQKRAVVEKLFADMRDAGMRVTARPLPVAGAEGASDEGGAVTPEQFAELNKDKWL